MWRRRSHSHRARPLLVHVTTSDMSLELLLGPQLRAFLDHGYEVVAVSAPGPYVAQLEADGIRHLDLPGASRSWSLSSDVRAFWNLFRLFRELDPDVVHTHTPKPGVYGRIAARMAGVPKVVNTVHGLYATPDDRAAKRLAVYGIERFAACFSDVELVQSEEDFLLMRDRLRIPVRKLVLLGNGVDLARFDPSAVSRTARDAARLELGATDDEQVVIGFVGRLVKEKGLIELLDAARIVTAQCPRARFALIGFHDSSRADGVSSTVLEQAVDEGIAVLGPRHDVVELYSAMDIFVLPSHREGFPRSVMEASAMGIPVVATDIRGCREAVDHEVTGLLVPMRRPDRLATALSSLVEQASLRADYGRAGRRKACLEFDSAALVRRSVAAYDLPASS